MSKTVSPENKQIAKYLAGVIGGEPKVNAYNHDTLPLSIDVLRLKDRPCVGVTTYTTIGLSDHSMKPNGEAHPARVELLAACESSEDNLLANTLATASFIVIRTQQFIFPGAVLPQCVSEYIKDTPLPHLYFTTPFLWEGKLKSLDAGSKKVHWLLSLPITNSEYEFLQKHGVAALEDLFEKKQIDIYNLNRKSVV